MATYTLRLYTDRLEPKVEVRLPACNRVIYVRDGDGLVRAQSQAAGLAANSAWCGRDAVTVIGGAAGATLLRWELAAQSVAPRRLRVVPFWHRPAISSSRR